MFYSETLLSKTGPLARVWLSANLERKLSKSHILQSDIEKSVGAIVGQNQAPMALRLSGQLLLGVVRIYSRKARYLLEDCNEALMKIKMVRLEEFICLLLCNSNSPFSRHSGQATLISRPVLRHIPLQHLSSQMPLQNWIWRYRTHHSYSTTLEMYPSHRQHTPLESKTLR